MISVVTAASTRRLTTLDAMGQDLGNEPLELDALIDRASAAAERYCHRIFAQQAYREVFYGHRGGRLFLRQAPLIVVTTMMAGDIEVTDYLIESAEAGILVWPISPHRHWGMWDITVDYIAAFLLPGQTNPPEPTGPALPFDVEQGVLEMVKVWYHERNPSTRISSKTFGLTGDRVEYALMSSRGALPPLTRELLKPWRRMVLV